MIRKSFGLIVLFLGIILFTTACQAEPKSSDEPDNTSVIADDVTYGASDYTKISDASNQLGFNALQEVSENEDGNRFISPVSLFMALSMIQSGADGTTKDEISSALAIDQLSDQQLHKANASLLAGIQKSSDDIVLNIANSMWINDDYTFRPAFAETGRDYFNAEIEEVDIENDQSAEAINDWVEQATNGTIDRIVDGPLDPSMAAMLVNAVYFQGQWMHAFDSDETESGKFHTGEDDEKELPFMTLEQELPYVETDSFKAVSLPYSDEQMSMEILLPKQNASLAEIKQQLTPEKWESLHDDLTKQEGTLQMPAFNLSYETSLKQVLKQLGIKTAFADKQADLSKMFTDAESLVISDVIQKTHLTVDEEGTEASGATSVEIEKTSASGQEPFNMKVDRPFLVTIRDNETDLILFIGTVKNPQSES